MTTDDSPVLAFTGERFTPECEGEIWLEHWHRYLFAQSFAKGRRVLDAACGEGYGSHLLAQVAAQVTGVDVSAEAVEHASRRYGHAAGLIYQVGDCRQLPLPDASFDLVVSFETIEHVHDQDAVLAEFRRVLRPDGILIISSPNKKVYSDDRNYRNEFHVKEFYGPEFGAFLRPHFRTVRLYGQKTVMHSAIWPEGVGADRATVAIEGQREANRIPYEPLYYLAVCGDQLPAAELSILGDADEWLVRHYEDGMRRMIRLDRELHEREARYSGQDALLAARERDVAALRETVTGLEREIARRRTWQWWVGVPVRRIRRWLRGR
jgi:SAM-dependent methyltransferase